MNLDNPIRPPLQVFTLEAPHPSQRRGNAYPAEVRQMAVQNQLNGHAESPAITLLQQQHQYPHPSSVARFIARHHAVGHSRPYRRSGNARAQREVDGFNLIHLSIYRAFLPKATYAELNAFLWVMNSHDPTYVPYCNSQLNRAHHTLHLTRKRASTTAYQALEPRNLQWRTNYWNMNHPFGMADADPRFVIDLDEASGSVDGANRKAGICLKGNRAREVGPYSKSDKVTLLLAVRGDPANPDRWFDTWLEGGTTVDRFYLFIQRILNDLGPGRPGNVFTFTMDNLNAHTNNGVQALIFNAGHRLIFRAPYYPVDGAIEYIFNVIECALCIRLREIFNTADYIQNLSQIIVNLPDFSPFFRHVGFIY